ncbi:H-NS histone family protein [Candidatus Methylospira mobilis]|uniref:H-NS histone family protein n=1 Tax=Candidatus Methylospira mobilis TaxID=1808979 RepID=A0A5Q0BJK1_9GAMM|nr:H-NS family nucleoid-associated regulatory protein [Candidatus Methylospira mobilis]QFY42338.1 H-NS histone family protein [Candidatus Methylospira mobilis]WNV04571.1 H-NS family nucleoid-associated regulatory protein [Candidatus Methylospira mobilis]
MSTYRELQKQIAVLTAQAEAMKAKVLAEIIAVLKETIQKYGITAAQLGFRAEDRKSSSVF